MAIDFKKTQLSGHTPEIWRGECKILPGGFKPVQNFPVGTVLHRGTPIYVDFEAMSAAVCKTAKVLKGGTTTAPRVAKGLAEGDILVEATEYAETGGGSGSDPIPAAPRYTPNMVVGAAKEFTGKGLPTIDAAYEAVVLYPSLNFPLLEDWLINPGKVCLKANPNILFIKQ